MSFENIDVGNTGEIEARDYLLGKGYRWIESNFRTRYGEIDLVMEDKGTIVFVEVKKRRDERYGEPELAVTREKQHHLIRVALAYIMQKKFLERPLRFDVIALSRSGIKHIEDAVQADGHYYY
jgi:putative endonuclease